MDVTPPGAAGTASRPSRNTPSGIPLVLRRLAIGLAGAALAVLAGVACALSFDDLRALAVSGRAEPRLAYLYPAAFDVLLVVALVSVPLLRGARFLVRLQAGFVLLLLLASAAAANASTAIGVSFDPDASALVVALSPWVMLAIGLWLLLLLLKHVRTNRADLDDDDDDSDDDLVPFDGAREPRAAVTAPYPVAVQERPAHAVTEEHGAPPLQPVPEAVAPPGYVPPLPVSPVSETVAPPEYAPPLPVTPPQAEEEAGPRGITPDTDEDGARLPPEAIPETVPEPTPETGSEAMPDQTPDQTPNQTPDEPEVLPVVPPTAAPRTPPVTEQADPDVTEPAVTEPAVTEPVAEPATDEHARDAESVAAGTAAQPTPEAPSPAETDDRPAQPRRNRPVRWGDLVRPHTGDVLVHPRPRPDEPADAEPERPEDEAGVDTQPLRQIRDVPDPAHASDCADPAEQDGKRGPHATEDGHRGAPETGDAEEGTGEGTVPMAPPSGRMRSTPRPPA
ncbi:DUF2637 domain-containing protein [Microbispora catharanthi]|uniref:DUF2637 domain-containing protein n=1 Tax=Microbispora catharanthi TaxID=1712871 RepID=A0A5N6B2R4_9ACTN|nr:DUF2637 domain-containing protein [Microbispora catharanthi]KAB8175074.1 DUF2637 domain-containing protein [Microbispora catharanthi]